jgi:hypothetical protein
MFKIKKQKYTVTILCTICKTVRPDTIYYLLYTEIYLFHIINNATIYLLIISKKLSYISVNVILQEIIYLQ